MIFHSSPGVERLFVRDQDITYGRTSEPANAQEKALRVGGLEPGAHRWIRDEVSELGFR